MNSYNIIKKKRTNVSKNSHKPQSCPDESYLDATSIYEQYIGGPHNIHSNNYSSTNK